MSDHAKKFRKIAEQVVADASARKIAEQVVADASAVKCPVRDYVEGLEEIISSLEACLAGAKDDLRHEERELDE